MKIYCQVMHTSVLLLLIAYISRLGLCKTLLLDVVPWRQKCFLVHNSSRCSMTYTIQRFSLSRSESQWAPIVDCQSDNLTLSSLEILELNKYWLSDERAIENVWQRDGSCFKKHIKSIHSPYDYFYEALRLAKAFTRVLLREEITSPQEIEHAFEKEWYSRLVILCGETKSNTQLLMTLRFCFNENFKLVNCSKFMRNNCSDEHTLAYDLFVPTEPTTVDPKKSSISSTPGAMSSHNFSEEKEIIMILRIVHSIDHHPMWNIHSFSIWDGKNQERVENCDRCALFQLEGVLNSIPTLATYWPSHGHYAKWSLDWATDGTCFLELKVIEKPVQYYSLGLLLLKRFNLVALSLENKIYEIDELKSELGDVNNSVILNCELIEDSSFLHSMTLCFAQDLSPHRCPEIMSDSCHSPIVTRGKLPQSSYFYLFLMLSVIFLVLFVVSVLIYVNLSSVGMLDTKPI